MNESESCADFDNLSVEESEVWNSRSSSHRSQGTRNVATFFVGTRLLSVFVFLCVVCFSVCLFRFRAWQLALATRGLSFADQSWNLYIQMSHLSRIMYNKAAAEKRRPKTKNKANFCILRHWLWSGYVSYPHRQHPHPQKQIVKKIMSCRRKNKGRKREENLVFFLRSLPSFHCCRLFLVGEGSPILFGNCFQCHVPRHVLALACCELLVVNITTCNILCAPSPRPRVELPSKKSGLHRKLHARKKMWQPYKRSYPQQLIILHSLSVF